MAVHEGEAPADLRAPAGVLETDADGTWVTLSWSSVPAAGSALWTVEPQTLSFVALLDGAAPEPRIVSLRNDGDAEARHHDGVVDPGYTSGIAGIAWISHPIAVGWSHLPSGS